MSLRRGGTRCSVDAKNRVPTTLNRVPTAAVQVLVCGGARARLFPVSCAEGTQRREGAPLPSQLAEEGVEAVGVEEDVDLVAVGGVGGIGEGEEFADEVLHFVDGEFAAALYGG